MEEEKAHINWFAGLPETNEASPAARTTLRIAGPVPMDSQG